MMPQDNLARMIQLADEAFDMHNDPDQIQVSARVIERMKKIHPASLAEKSTRHGPAAWILVFPTTKRLMELFLDGKINERELFRRTHVGRSYDVVYLCSALVLPEYRNKGIARRLTVASIKAIRKQHPIEALFYWSFSREGIKLAESVAREVGLPVYKIARHAAS